MLAYDKAQPTNDYLLRVADLVYKQRQESQTKQRAQVIFVSNLQDWISFFTRKDLLKKDPISVETLRENRNIVQVLVKDQGRRVF